MRYSILFLLCLLLVRCSSSENPPPKLPASVYVTGMHEAYEMAYWKDGKRFLPDDDGAWSTSSDIAVSDDDVYVSGQINSDNYRNVACYWKNEELFVIGSSLETDTTWTQGIAVSEGDVYVAGTQLNADGFQAVYWKNGVLHELNSSPNQSIVNGMMISDGDVYICGYTMIYDPEEYYPRYQAAYWKNGVLKLLSDGGIESMAEDIAVENGDVYIVGYNYIWSAGNQRKVVYWKNDEQHELSPISDPSDYYLIANGIAVEDGHVYISGREFSFGSDIPDKGIYWIDGEATSIASASNDISLSAIAVWEGEVFTTGMEDGRGYYWWNKKRYELEGNQPFPAAITVAPK